MEQQPQKTIMVEPTKEGSKTVEEVKSVLKEAFKPGKNGFKVSGVRKGHNGVLVTVADEGSWSTIAKSTKLRERGLKVETPTRRSPRVSVFGMERDIEKDDLVKLAFAQNAKRLLSEAKEEFVPLYRIGKRNHVKGAWVIRRSQRIRKHMVDPGRGHEREDCFQLHEPPVYVNCSRFNRPSDHNVSSKGSCPCWLQ